MARGGHVAAEQGRQLGAQCHPGRARQRRQVDHQRRLAFTGIRQRVTQDDPTLGVGVADFDVQALAGLEHIPWPVGITGNGVLYRGQQHLQAHRQLERHHQRGEPECIGCTTHVFFHLAHALSALDVQATTVETHPFADQAEQGIPGLAPGQFDQARAPGAGASDSVDGGEVLLQQRLTHHLAEFRAVLLGHHVRGGGEFFWPHVFGRCVDQIPRGSHGGGQRNAALGVRAGGQQ